MNVPGSPTTGKRGGILNSVTRAWSNTNMVGSYAQLAYGFNYWNGGQQPDELVVVHQIGDPECGLAGASLTPEREKAAIPPAWGPR